MFDGNAKFSLRGVLKLKLCVALTVRSRDLLKLVTNCDFAQSSSICKQGASSPSRYRIKSFLSNLGGEFLVEKQRL